MDKKGEQLDFMVKPLYRSLLKRKSMVREENLVKGFAVSVATKITPHFLSARFLSTTDYSS